MQNVHSVVYSLNPQTTAIANLNRDVLCLDWFVSYTIPQYLEDRASEGATLLSVDGNSYSFSDGATEVLIQQIERWNRA